MSKGLSRVSGETHQRGGDIQARVFPGTTPPPPAPLPAPSLSGTFPGGSASSTALGPAPTLGMTKGAARGGLQAWPCHRRAGGRSRAQELPSPEEGPSTERGAALAPSIGPGTMRPHPCPPARGRHRPLQTGRLSGVAPSAKASGSSKSGLVWQGQEGTGQSQGRLTARPLHPISGQARGVPPSPLLQVPPGLQFIVPLPEPSQSVESI